MKNTYKFLIIILLVVFIVPQVALASWWNPFSWGIWSKIFNKPQTQNPVVCTMEARQCPDGSYVGRKGPKCDFDVCPTTKPTETASWNTYTNAKLGLSFKYPQSLKVSEADDVIKNRVVISHSVAYKHGDPCDFVGNRPPLNDLTDFYVWFNVLTGSVESVISDKSMPAYDFPNEKVNIGGYSGYKYTVGIEMCGMDYYYLAVSPTKTLWIGSQTITELSSILPQEEVNKYLAIPGIINTTEHEVLLNKIVSTFKFTK
jgi:hypothetical protein